jgi:hypothetical protein
MHTFAGGRELKSASRRRNTTIWTLAAVVAAQCLLPACLDNLCTKRLYIYRDTEQMSPPPADMTLLIADPAILTVLGSEAPKEAGALPWTPEQPNYASDCYRLSIDGLDDRLVYQGRCMNVTPTEVCEVRPGSRRVLVSVELMGPWGRERLKESVPLTLKPGEVIFFYPDWQKAAQHAFRLQTRRVPLSYDAASRTKLMDWQRRHTQGRSLVD